jgi:cytoskeletal protein RodZ
MSLINDALKRAKQAQQPHSPDAPQMRVQFRPVEANQQIKRSNAGIWIAVVIGAGLIIGFVFRQMTRNNSSTPKEAKAREIVAAKPIVHETAAPPTPAGPAPTPTPVPVAATPPPQTAKPVPQETVIKESTPAAPVVVVQEETPKITPRLQAVVYDPKRPSAIISGKSVFKGDRVGDFRVARITQESVTLVGGGQTNVLVLGE